MQSIDLRTSPCGKNFQHCRLVLFLDHGHAVEGSDMPDDLPGRGAVYRYSQVGFNASLVFVRELFVEFLGTEIVLALTLHDDLTGGACDSIFYGFQEFL